ncbi:hypothetical protein BX600DRAFT_538727 [Xylariales sp. PMI_506]|nr:hypothetical protein BX600DRAFT_538727 [Xylariales sp. PMI_506]
MVRRSLHAQHVPKDLQEASPPAISIIANKKQNSDILHRHELIHSANTESISRQRWKRACIHCAKARERCDRNAPCSRCCSKSLECSYPCVSARKSGRPRQTSAAAGSAAGKGTSVGSFPSSSPSKIPTMESSMSKFHIKGEDAIVSPCSESVIGVASGCRVLGSCDNHLGQHASTAQGGQDPVSPIATPSVNYNPMDPREQVVFSPSDPSLSPSVVYIDQSQMAYSPETESMKSDYTSVDLNPPCDIRIVIPPQGIGPYYQFDEGGFSLGWCGTQTQMPTMSSSSCNLEHEPLSRSMSLPYDVPSCWIPAPIDYDQLNTTYGVEFMPPLAWTVTEYGLVQPIQRRKTMAAEFC